MEEDIDIRRAVTPLDASSANNKNFVFTSDVNTMLELTYRNLTMYKKKNRRTQNER